jgi:hypothetical protein
MHCWWCAGDADAQDEQSKICFKKPGAEVGNPLEALEAHRRAVEVTVP